MDYLFIAIGLIGLLVGGDALVRGSVAIAHRLSIPPLVIGLTIVAFGTSAPELLVSVQAALRGVPDIAIGNIVGSNIANILLIIGISALIAPIQVNGGPLRRDCLFLVGSACLMLPFFLNGEIGRTTGGLLVTLLIGYLLLSFLKPGPATPSDDLPSTQSSLLISVIWVAVGLAALVFGAHFLVDGSVSVARTFGVSEAFIGLTIVAVGTSLPELATSLIAAYRRQSDIAIGNVVGSNIFNVLGILGITALITPIPVADRFARFDLPVMLAATFVLAALLLLPQSVARGVGGALLVAYVGYIFAAQS